MPQGFCAAKPEKPGLDTFAARLSHAAVICLYTHGLCKSIDALHPHNPALFFLLSSKAGGLTEEKPTVILIEEGDLIRIVFVIDLPRLRRPSLQAAAG